MCPNGDKLTIHRQQRSKTLLFLLEGDENKWSFNLRLKDGSASSKLVAFAQISGSAWKNHLHLGFSVWSDCQSIARYNFSLERYNIARYNFSSYSIEARALQVHWGPPGGVCSYPWQVATRRPTIIAGSTLCWWSGIGARPLFHW